MKQLLILLLILLLPKFSTAAWVNIKAFNVDTSNNQIKISFSIEENSLGWQISRISSYFNSTDDTLTVRIFRKIEANAFQATSIIDSSVTIIPNNFPKLCYLKFYNCLDTNIFDNTLLIYADSFITDSAFYNFQHCTPLAIMEAPLENRLLYYPNPIQNNLFINILPAEIPIKIIAIDMIGKTVELNWTINNNFLNIRTSALPNGKYHFTIFSKNKVNQLDILKSE